MGKDSRWRFVVGFFLMLAVCSLFAAACSDDEGCSLNGVCQGGACACDAEWSGDACERLRLVAPAAIVPAYPPPSLAASTTSWGGSVVRDGENRYHMYTAAMSNECGMSTWTTNSLIQHAIADKPEGPYSRADVLMRPFAHNPAAVRAPDGTYLIYHIGCGRPISGSKPCTNCSGGYSGKDCPSIGEEVGCTANTTNILHSASPDGPWEQLNAPFVKSATMGVPYGVDNPTAFFFPNGSLLMLGRGGDPAKESSSDGIIRADSWRGPYVMHSKLGGAGSPDVEDPFVRAAPARRPPRASAVPRPLPLVRETRSGKTTGDTSTPYFTSSPTSTPTAAGTPSRATPGAGR